MEKWDDEKTMIIGNCFCQQSYFLVNMKQRSWIMSEAKECDWRWSEIKVECCDWRVLKMVSWDFRNGAHEVSETRSNKCLGKLET